MALDTNTIKETEADDRAIEREEESKEKELDTSLSSLFNNTGDDDEDEIEPEVAKEEEKPVVKEPTQEQDDSRYNSLQEQLATLRDNQIRLQTENEILRGKRDGSLKEEEESSEFEVDFAELNAEIQADPAKAITKLINSITPQIEKRVLKQAAQHTSTTVGRSTALQNDVTAARSQFGNLPFDNPEFGRMAEAIYEELTDGAPVINSNGTRYRPGAVMQSMEIAYARMVRAGKMKPGEMNGNGNIPTITERKKPPLNPRIGSSSDGEDERPADALSGFSTREIATMKQTARKMGVPFEKVLKRMSKLRADDPGYGGLRNG